MGTRRIVVGTVYRPPGENFDMFLSALEDVQRLNSFSHTEVVISGDFNCDLLSADNAGSVNFLNCMSGIVFSSLSDHFPVYIVLRNILLNSSSSDSSRVVKYRSLNEDALSSMNGAIQGYDFSDILACDDVNTGIVKFDEVVMKYFNQCCPILSKTVSYKNYLKPWIDGYVKARDEEEG